MSTAKIVNTEDSFSVDVKRFYIPGTIISDTCAKCQNDCEFDLGDYYLAYPSANTVMNFNCNCSECSHTWSVSIQLHISVSLEESGNHGESGNTE